MKTIDTTDLINFINNQDSNGRVSADNILNYLIGAPGENADEPPWRLMDAREAEEWHKARLEGFVVYGENGAIIPDWAICTAIDADGMYLAWENVPDYNGESFWWINKESLTRVLGWVKLNGRNPADTLIMRESIPKFSYEKQA